MNAEEQAAATDALVQFHMVSRVLDPQPHGVRTKCPECGFNCNHINRTERYDGHDNYKAKVFGWWGRGDVIAVVFDGECGHQWRMCFGFHKGEIYVWV
jgi:hypothetical protein